MIELPYNKKDPKSIEAYAKRLLNRSLRDLLGNDVQQTYTGKGKLGQILEDLYFHYKPNSRAEPDFPEAGVELKSTPIKKIKKGFVSKERLVFNIIDYEKEHGHTFEKSDFWKKNKLLLLMFYLYEKEKIDLDYIFKIISLWEFPERDIKIIKDDWEKIVFKIRAGKAHELSEGDTLYLGACTKGANKTTLRKQPFSDELAKQRAFSLKSKYLNFIITNNLAETDPIIKDVKEYGKGKTFEELVIKKFEPYYGMSIQEIMKKLNVKETNSKSKAYIISKAILGVKESLKN